MKAEYTSTGMPKLSPQANTALVDFFESKKSRENGEWEKFYRDAIARVNDEDPLIANVIAVRGNDYPEEYKARAQSDMLNIYLLIENETQMNEINKLLEEE